MAARAIVMEDEGASSTLAETVSAGEGDVDEASEVASVAEHALRDEETTRAITFVTVGAVLAFLGAVVHGIILLGGIAPPSRIPIELPSLCGMVLFGGVSALVRQRIRRRRMISEGEMHALGLAGSFLAISFVVHMGPFSPAVVLVVLGFSFFGLSGSGKVAVLYPSVAIGSHVAYSLLVAADLVPDVGLFPSDSAPKLARVTVTLFMAALCYFALWQARCNRRATHEAVTRAGEMARAMRLREAQLREARLDIERLRGRGFGRYTGTSVGAYRLGDIIGRGAMGEVYAALHVESGEGAAVKLLNVSCVGDPSLVARFLRETSIGKTLRGPNVVEVYESGEATDGTPYLAMERLVGDDLAAILRDEPRFDLETTLALVDDVARGLSLAHAHGVVHRDLKPQNIFLAERGSSASWTLLDFGVASVAAGTTLTLTRDQIVGTPGYMAPEQALGESGGPRADVFSLGAVVYRVLTGEAPFGGNAVVAMHAVVYERPTRPGALVSALPVDVERVLALALAKSPEQRFASATDFADALRRAASGRLDVYTRVRADLLDAWSHP